MKAIILAAGYATRLYPLTKDRPKPLLPIREKPIIDYIMDQIDTIPAVDMVYVVTNQKFAGHFERWAAEAKHRLPITVVDDGTLTNETRLGAIGDIAFTLEAGKIDDDILIIAGDNYFTYPLREQYDFYLEKGGDCLCAQRFEDMEAIKSLAVAVLDENGKVIGLEEKPQEPKSDLAVFATYIYTRDTVKLFPKYLAEGNNTDAPGHFPQWLYKIKPVYVYIMNGKCYDVGTLKAYEEVQTL